MGACPSLPESLQDIDMRAEFVNAVNGEVTTNVPNGLLFLLSQEQLNEKMQALATFSSTYIPDCSDSGSRVNLTLRLWSGCVAAAKTIATDTMSGLNTSADRARIFSEFIDPNSQVDEIFKAGVEAAPAFKALSNQEISFEGVPRDSCVRNYAPESNEATRESR